MAKPSEEEQKIHDQDPPPADLVDKVKAAAAERWDSRHDKQPEEK